MTARWAVSRRPNGVRLSVTTHLQTVQYLAMMQCMRRTDHDRVRLNLEQKTAVIAKSRQVRLLDSLPRQSAGLGAASASPTTSTALISLIRWRCPRPLPPQPMRPTLIGAASVIWLHPWLGLAATRIRRLLVGTDRGNVRWGGLILLLARPVFCRPPRASCDGATTIFVP